MSLPIVTNENYFSTECNMAYMGSSQFKAFQKCEAAALAEAKGEYVRPETTALLVGSYVDAYFSGELPQFCATHPQIFNKKNGTLKADYVKAQEIIDRMEEDDLYLLLMAGDHQTIRTGYINGVPFKIKIDSFLSAGQCKAIAERFPETRNALGMCDGAIVDQKCMRDTESVWSEDARARISFVEAWGYDIQGAIYQAIEGHMLPFILAVGTKQDEPDLQALYIPDTDLQAKLAEVEDMAPRYQAIKEGKIQPTRCGNCPYCRMTKRLTGIIDYKDIEI